MKVWIMEWTEQGVCKGKVSDYRSDLVWKGRHGGEEWEYYEKMRKVGLQG